MQALGLNTPDPEDVTKLGLCPICKINYITEDETVCSTCYADTDLTDEELDERYGHNDIKDDSENDDVGEEDDDGLQVIDNEDAFLADDDDLELINVDGINNTEEEEEEEEEENKEDDDPLSDFEEDDEDDDENDEEDEDDYDEDDDYDKD
jgi:hypothetical protein